MSLALCFLPVRRIILGPPLSYLWLVFPYFRLGLLHLLGSAVPCLGPRTRVESLIPRTLGPPDHMVYLLDTRSSLWLDISSHSHLHISHFLLNLYISCPDH